MAVLDALRRKQDFTATEEALANYVLQHADDVAEMSIAQLSAVAHTSNAAVVRFCHKIGIDGYRAFRLELARELERSRAHVMDVNPDQPFFEDATTKDVVSSIAALSKQAIDATYDMISVHDVRKAARLIRGARRVVLYATGDTRISLMGFSNLLLKLGIVCVMGDQLGDTLVVGNFLGPQDVAVVVTYAGTLLHDGNDGLNVARAQGCKVIVVTAEPSVGDKLAGHDCMLLLPKHESRRGRIATYFSQACIRYVLNCIYGEVFSQGWQESMEARDRYATRSWVEEPEA